MFEKEISFTIKGIVYGKYWGGGEGSYPSVTLKGNNLASLMQEAKEKLSTGGLDSGMGFQSLIGAMLEIETRTTIMYEGKPYTNKEWELEFIGNLTEQQQDYLETLEIK